MYIYIHTHTYTYIYIYVCVQVLAALLLLRGQILALGALHAVALSPFHPAFVFCCHGTEAHFSSGRSDKLIDIRFLSAREFSNIKLVAVRELSSSRLTGIRERSCIRLLGTRGLSSIKLSVGIWECSCIRPLAWKSGADPCP